MDTLGGFARARSAGYVAGLLGVVVVTWLIELASGQVNVLSMAVCFQLLVLVVSGAYGLGSGLATGLLSAVAFNWFFVPPVHTLTIADSRNWVSLAVFAATAVITSYLAEGFRRQGRESEERRRDAELLTRMAEAVLGEIGAEPSTTEVARAAAEALGVERCRILLGPAGDADASRAPTALVPTGAGFTVPLIAGGEPLGLLEVGPARADEEPRWATPGFAAAVAGLAAVALERGRLIATALEAEGLRRSDGLKTALLHGVSHEFRTPLTAIRTAAHALSAGAGASGEDGAALLAVMGEETERLDRLVANLLDLSRLEAGALVTRIDWCAPAEMVAGAIDAAGPFLDGVEIATRVPSDVPLVRADAVLCERILVNLLHNAVRHGAPPVAVESRVAGERLEIAVIDAGTGLDAAAGRIFEPFVAGGRAAGTGLGLALARGLAEVQGASLATERADQMTRFVLSFPLGPAPDVVGD
jgi:two-component system, OmpR family, sensor histidine kinase KdpD